MRVYRGIAMKDPKTASYMATCIAFMVAARTPGTPTMDGPTAVDIEAVVRRPQRLVPRARGRTPQPPAGEFPAPCKPDLDNLAKSILDSLVQAGVIVDDCRVVELTMRKVYAAVGDEPCVRVVVRPA